MAAHLPAGEADGGILPLRSASPRRNGQNGDPDGSANGEQQ